MRYMVIRTESLAKNYGPRTVVKNLTLEVEPGEIYGFLGPKGAGKTTTIRMLLDIIRPTSGRAVLLGLDSHRHGLAVRQQVGYLPSEFRLDNHQTGVRALESLARLRGGVDASYIDELAARLNARLDAPLGSLSQADQTKIGIIQAFMHRPELIILDEPTRHLNDEEQRTLYQLISAARSEGRSVFLSSKSICEMERICDRTAILHQGELIAVERGVSLRSRALRHIQMRFAAPITADIFSGLVNLFNVRLEENYFSCTVRGDPDPLIKLASQYRVTDFISQTPSLEEVYHQYYGVGCSVV